MLEIEQQYIVYTNEVMNLTEWNAPFETLIFRCGRRLSWLEREVLTWLPVPFPHGWRVAPQQLDLKDNDWTGAHGSWKNTAPQYSPMKN